jgi:hypothetical protein
MGLGAICLEVRGSNGRSARGVSEFALAGTGVVSVGGDGTVRLGLFDGDAVVGVFGGSLTVVIAVRVSDFRLLLLDGFGLPSNGCGGVEFALSGAGVRFTELGPGVFRANTNNRSTIGLSSAAWNGAFRVEQSVTFEISAHTSRSSFLLLEGHTVRLDCSAGPRWWAGTAGVVAIDNAGFSRPVKVGETRDACDASLEIMGTVVALKRFRIARQVGHECEIEPVYTLPWHIRSEFHSDILAPRSRFSRQGNSCLEWLI